MTHVHLNTLKIIHHIILWVQNQEKALVIMIGMNDYKAASWS
jgi:hypothetical protein